MFACGPLGLGDDEYRNAFPSSPPILAHSKVAKRVIPSSSFTMFLAEDNTVHASGKNDCGQLGLGDTNNRRTVTAVPALPDGKVAKQVVAGSNFTMILAEDGTVFASGSNAYGQLGLGDLANRNAFAAVPALPDGKVAKQVIAGRGHTVILAEDGIRDVERSRGLGDVYKRQAHAGYPHRRTPCRPLSGSSCDCGHQSPAWRPCRPGGQAPR